MADTRLVAAACGDGNLLAFFQPACFRRDETRNPSLDAAASALKRLEAAAAAFVAVTVLAAAYARRRCKRAGQRPPFQWVVHQAEAHAELSIGGRWRDVVEKRGVYEVAGWVIPVNGKIRMHAGHVYHWALAIEQMSRDQPEIQFGIQGLGFARPWRLVTTTRLSRSSDEEPWLPRPAGDRRLRERDVVHIELDLTSEHGALLLAVNGGPFERFFDDIPTASPLMPVVMLGGRGSRVRVEASARRSQGGASDIVLSLRPARLQLASASLFGIAAGTGIC